MKIPRIIKLPSGNYFCHLRIDGQNIPITEPTKDRCAARAMAYKSGMMEIKKHPENMTLKAACKKYVEENRARLSPTTVQGYEKIYNNAFPELMNRQLKAITNTILQRAVNDECKRISPRTKRKYSPKTIVNNYMFVVPVLHQYVPGLNTDATLPEVKDKPVFILTPEEAYSAVKGSSVELPVLLSMWLSLTVSEIRGLTKSKSIHNGQISVVDTVVDIKGKPVRKEGGKEVKRTRTLDIPPYIQELIDKVDGDVLVPMTAQTITKRFYRLLDKAGLPHMAFHKLRHVNASVMADLNIPPHIANARGGWKTNYTRERVYTHEFPAARKEADQKIDARFNAIIAQNVNENANEKQKPVENQQV